MFLRILTGITICLFLSGGATAQTSSLVVKREINLPMDDPYGVTWHDGHFWITSPANGMILRMGRDLEDLHRIRAPRDKITGITFEGRTPWVLVDAWDTINYPHHDLPKTQVYKLDPADGQVIDSVIVPYYNVPKEYDRYMFGLAWYDSSLYASFNNLYGPALSRIEGGRYSDVCCARPKGMEVVRGTLWSIRNNNDIYTIEPDGGGSSIRAASYIMPVVIDDSGSYDDWSKAMEFQFNASDLAYDGEHFWLLDPDEKKLKMVERDSPPPGPVDTIPPVPPVDTLIPGPPADTTGPSTWYIELIPEVPVAGQEVKVVTHGICYLDVSIDLSGRHISLNAYYGSCVASVCGIDTVSLGILGEDSYTLDYFLYDVCLNGGDGDSLVYYDNVNFEVLNGTSGKVQQQHKEDVLLYPNPASREVFVDLPVRVNAAEISLYGVDGRLVRKTNFRSTGRYRMDLSGIGAGCYLLRIRSGNQVYTGRISVIK